MLSYRLKCIEKTDSKKLNVAKAIKRKVMILSKCAVWDCKKLSLSKKKTLVGY